MAIVQKQPSNPKLTTQPKPNVKPKNKTSRKPDKLTPANANFTNVNDVATLQQGADKAAQRDSILGQNADFANDFGSSTTTVDPNTGQATVRQGATGLNSQLLDMGQRLGNFGLGLAGNQLRSFEGMQPFSTGNIDPRFGIPTASNADRSRIEDELYGKYTQDLDQNYQQTLEDKKQELADRGITVGSPAYTAEMDRVDKGYQRQKTEARSQAVAGAGQEMSSQFGMGLQSRQQAVGEMVQDYSMPLSLATSLQGMGYGYQNPTLPGYTGANATPTNFTDPGNLAIGAAEKQKDRQAQIALQRSSDAARLSAARIAASTANQGDTSYGMGGSVY